MFFLEVGIGQFMSEGGISVWKMCPLFQGECRGVGSGGSKRAYSCKENEDTGIYTLIECTHGYMDF